MSLAEVYNEDAVEMLADILEPASEIISDKTFAEMVNDGTSRIKVVTYVLRTYKKQIVEIMARIDCVPLDEYKINAITLPVKLIRFMNSEEFKELFGLQAQSLTSVSSGSAMANTEETEEN